MVVDAIPTPMPPEPLEFCPDIVDSDGNIVGQVQVDIAFDNDPVMPNVMSGEAASVLVAMMDSDIEANTCHSWSDSCWNQELDALFSISSPKIKPPQPAKEPTVKHSTSHRILTSHEVL